MSPRPYLGGEVEVWRHIMRAGAATIVRTRRCNKGEEGIELVDSQASETHHVYQVVAPTYQEPPVDRCMFGLGDTGKSFLAVLSRAYLIDDWPRALERA